MTDAEGERRAGLVVELRRLWKRGSAPSALLRVLEGNGVVGAGLILEMQRAFGLSLAKTNAITAWVTDRDDERLDRFLAPYMLMPVDGDVAD